MSKKQYLLFLVVIILTYPFTLLASMSDYCSTPPFLTTAVKSNALLVMDFSGSMQFPAYYGYAFYGYYSSKVAMCGYDGDIYANYDPSIYYYGYFESDKYYRYNSSGGYWEVNSACTNTDKIGSGSCISGNLLNWLIMTRIDVALKALIGGKATCDTNYCYLRPQGSRRYVRSSSLHCKFYIRPNSYYTGDYASKDILINVYNYNGSCAIGTFSNRYAKVKIDKEHRNGIIQNNFNLVRFGFMVFASNHRYGEIRYGFNENDMDTLISKIQNEVPYYGTPTGEALWEAYDYLRQINSHRYERNSSYISRGTIKDPYYERLEDGSLVPVRCRKNFVVLISDGEWNGHVDPVRPAYYLHTGDLRSDLSGTQTAKVFTLFAFATSVQGERSMKTISAFGSFQEINGCSTNWPYTFSGFPTNSRYVSFPRTHCTPSINYKNCCNEWDEKDNNGIPDTYYAATNGAALQNALTEIFQEIVKQTSSGSAASILSKEAEAGSVMLQAVFYPQKQYGTGSSAKEINWTGYLYDWWLYTGKINGEPINNIREDTIQNQILDICEDDSSPGGDYIMEYIFQNGQLTIDAYKSNSIGQKAYSSPDVTYSSLDDTHPVWEAGINLCTESNPLINRIIYTVTGELEPSSPVLMTELKDINNTPSKKFSKLFGDDNGDGDIDEYSETYTPSTEISFSNLKRYIYGIEISGTRSRKINTGNTWKLGDIIYSTPKIANYDNLSVAFVGANDGMIHAFRIGKLRYDDLNAYQQVKLRDSKTEDDTSKLGKEIWAFIPKNVLPYLRFLADPNYCHLYYVDLSPYIIEIDTNQDGEIDKRILIGGMRLGGAVGCSGTNCVNPPRDTCSNPSNYNPNRDPSTTTPGCIGLSSYFALDVTNPESPYFLWEFSNPDLGFSYTGPAFIKRKDSSGSWHYYIMFVSGPTTYNGESAQDLRIFILRLNNNFTISSKIVIDGNNTYSISGFSHKKDPDLSTFNNSFGGRLFSEGIDYNEDGNTDMVFFGVTKKSGSTWHGNLVGVKINDIDPINWDVIKVFNSAIKPITAKIEYMKCFNMNYIFFGTGRYFYKEDDPGQNANDVERLYGVRIDECLQGGNCHINAAHSSSMACMALTGGRSRNQLFSWYQKLNPKESGYFKERNISDPSISNSNTIFFSTTEPTSDLCSYGGRSRIWGLNCATGEALNNQSCPPYVVNEIKGTAYLQTSIGKINAYPISIGGSGGGNNPFTNKEGKVTPWTPGVTPESPTPFFSPSSGTTGSRGKILYWLEH